MFRMPDSYYDPPEPVAERDVERECPHCEKRSEAYQVKWSRYDSWWWDCHHCGKEIEEEDVETWSPPEVTYTVEFFSLRNGWKTYTSTLGGVSRGKAEKLFDLYVLFLDHTRPRRIIDSTGKVVREYTPPAPKPERRLEMSERRRPALEEMRENAGVLSPYVVTAIIDYALSLEARIAAAKAEGGGKDAE
jgi:hypothetical protein